MGGQGQAPDLVAADPPSQAEAALSTSSHESCHKRAGYCWNLSLLNKKNTSYDSESVLTETVPLALQGSIQVLRRRRKVNGVHWVAVEIKAGLHASDLDSRCQP